MHCATYSVCIHTGVVKHISPRELVPVLRLLLAWEAGASSSSAAAVAVSAAEASGSGEARAVWRVRRLVPVVVAAVAGVPVTEGSGALQVQTRRRTAGCRLINESLSTAGF
jgi:hypothetical protein